MSNFRTPLKRAAGLGSAKDGTGHFLWQRVTAIAVALCGIYLLGLIMTEGLPLIIELGIFLDVLIAVVILVILTSRLRLSFKTTDTNVLDKLKG